MTTATELDLSLSDEELATRIAHLPDGIDFSKTALFGLLEPPAPGLRDPARWVRIFDAASKTDGITSWMVLACTVQALNGRRRLTGDRKSYMAALAGFLGEIDMIEARALAGPMNENAWALAGDLGYNRGIVLRMLRSYAEAEQVQLRAAGHFLRAGRTESVYVQLFVAAVERTSAALVRDDRAAIEQALSHMVTLRDRIHAWCDPYPRWMRTNAALHVAWAHLLANIDYDERIQDETEARQSAVAHWRTTFEVVEHVRAGNWQEVVAKAAQAYADMQTLASSSRANTQLTVQWLQARALRQLGRFEEATNVLTSVETWDGEDGGVPMAIAADDLKK